MPPTVSVIAPGMMGSAVAKRLTAAGVKVRTSLKGRSAATIARADAAGMTDATDLELVQSDFILSIVPPGQAVALAERLVSAMRDARRKPVYVDCNAVSPDTVMRIDRIVRDAGGTFVDGGIIGPPPEADSTKPVSTCPVPPRTGRGFAGIRAVDADPARPGWSRLGHEDVLCRYHQRFYGARCCDDAGCYPRRDRGCVDSGDDGQPAVAAEMAYGPDAEDAQQSLSLGRRNGRNCRFRR